MTTGKQSTNTNISDVKWKTHHCIFGFNLMGIWDAYSDGTDINAIDVSQEHGLVFTADDVGRMNVLNYPSVVKHAPKRQCHGHSSFVTNIRLLKLNNASDRDSDRELNIVVASTGGHDSTLILWKVVDDTSNDEFKGQKFQITSKSRNIIPDKSMDNDLTTTVSRSNRNDNGWVRSNSASNINSNRIQKSQIGKTNAKEYENVL